MLDVIVIGGGISGSSTAYALSQKGFSVAVYEKTQDLESTPSANYQGLLYSNFFGQNNPVLDLSLAGYRYSYALITKLMQDQIHYNQCGIIQLSYDLTQQKKQNNLLNSNISKDLCYPLSGTEINDKAGMNINCSHGGIFFPYGMWVNLPSLVKNLLNHERINLHVNSNISEIKHVNKLWHVLDNTQTIINSAPHLVLCNSYNIDQFVPINPKCMNVARGQISSIKYSIPLKVAICANSYIIPNYLDSYTIGATFALNNSDKTIYNQDNLTNINNALKFIPDLQYSINNSISAQASVRGCSIDYLPLVGAVDGTSLYINALHGSKGLTYAPLCGEIVASYIAKQPLPINDMLAKKLNPTRAFNIKCTTH